MTDTPDFEAWARDFLAQCYCRFCHGRGGAIENVREPVNGDDALKWMPCPACNGAGHDAAPEPDDG